MELYTVVASECNGVDMHIFSPKLFISKEEAKKHLEKLFCICLQNFTSVTPDSSYMSMDGMFFSVFHEDTQCCVKGKIKKHTI